MHPDGAIHFFCIKTKREIVRVDIYVFMSLCLTFEGLSLHFFDIKTKRQMDGVDFCFLCLYV